MRKKLFLLTSVLLFTLNAFCQSANQYVKVETPQGWCIIKLYNQTPLHRNNFVTLVKSGYFNKTTFNRILKNFVIQGGDADSLYEKGHMLKPQQKWIAPEFNSALYHKRGAVAMGRDANPSESSFATQFYIVDGKKWSNEQLDEVEKKYKIHFSRAQRQIYINTGGTPFLDQHYTVFGEIVKGIDLIAKITAVKVDKNGNPDTEVWMKLTLLKPKEVGALLK
jgi:peptidyl-prolyl cis-trans isomerase B (cyclophilin B)